LFAFASANAVLFHFGCARSTDRNRQRPAQARWLRSLWLKAVLLIALLR